MDTKQQIYCIPNIATTYKPQWQTHKVKKTHKYLPFVAVIADLIQTFSSIRGKLLNQQTSSSAKMATLQTNNVRKTFKLCLFF